MARPKITLPCTGGYGEGLGFGQCQCSGARLMTPEGLRLLRDFISADEETDLIRSVDAAPWQTDLKRRVQQYGWRYDYRSRSVNPSDYLGDLPLWMGHIISRISRMDDFAKPPEQAIVNEYLPGQGIAPHTDCLPCFGPVIASLSLACAYEMWFERSRNGPKAFLQVPRKSLLILTGPARYTWRHAIAARKTDPNPNVHGAGRIARRRRISITFRTMG